MTYSASQPTDHLPDMERPVRHRSISSGAEVHRDSWGVPHIRSDDLYDLFFAQGYATAQDRLWQMDSDRLGGLGRASEYLGDSRVELDKLVRRRDFRRVAAADYDVCSDDAKTALDAYADGVNAFIDGPDPLPFEYSLLETKPERWEPWHCIVVYKLRNSAEGNVQGKAWLALLASRIGPERVAKLAKGYLPGMFLTVPPGAQYDGATQDAFEELKNAMDAGEPVRESDFGSNGWAISGDLTESGLPMVGGDSHRVLEFPNVYYQTHLTHPDFDVLGYSIPGMPMVMHFAHNRHVAWGMTHGGCDTQDIFVEQIRTSGDGVQYLFKDEWLDAEFYTEELRCFDPDEADGCSVETIDVIRTHHGPIVNGGLECGFGFALADPGSQDGTPWVDAALSAMRCRNADEFEAALAGWTDRVNNYVYADVHGEFGYCLKGRVPVRTFANAWGPVPGWTGVHDWQGFIPPHQLPRTRNPETGWVVSCNQRVVGDDYPFWLAASFGPDYRARRIISHIQRHIDEGREIGVADMREFHADSVSIPALQFKQWLVDASDIIEEDFAHDPEVLEAARALRDWDGDMSSGADPSVVDRSALLFRLISEVIALLLLRNQYDVSGTNIVDGNDYAAYDHYRRNAKPGFYAALASGRSADGWRGIHIDRLAMDGLVTAVRKIESFESEGWPMDWEELHMNGQSHVLLDRFPEPNENLDVPGVPVAGDEDVPLATTSRPFGSYATKSGPVNRYLHDPSGWSNGKWIAPLGASGNSDSPHFTDQLQMWADVEYIPQLYEWDEIRANAESVQKFRPAS